jgi:cytochrome c
MDREGWKVAWLAAAAAVAVIWSGDWFANQLVPTRYPGELAFKGAEDLPPSVDLASVQRGWPDSLTGKGDRGRLLAYIEDIEHQAPPPVAAPKGAGKAEPVADLGTLLASADAAAGKGKARVCITCHTLEQGEPNRLGPNLWGVVGRNIASHGGFAYSPAMKAEQGTWSYERLDQYLASPGRAIPGNKMAFAGLRRAQDRAAVIKYLGTLGGNAPVPEPMAAGGGQASGAK